MGSTVRLAGFFSFFFLVFTCSIWLVDHGLYYSSPGINKPGKRETKQRGEKETLNHFAFTRWRIHHQPPQRQTVLHDFIATLVPESLREEHTTKQQQTKGQLCADLGTQSGILLMFHMIYSPLF